MANRQTALALARTALALADHGVHKLYAAVTFNEIETVVARHVSMDDSFSRQDQFHALRLRIQALGGETLNWPPGYPFEHSYEEAAVIRSGFRSNSAPAGRSVLLLMDSKSSPPNPG